MVYASILKIHIKFEYLIYILQNILSMKKLLLIISCIGFLSCQQEDSLESKLLSKISKVLKTKEVIDSDTLMLFDGVEPGSQYSLKRNRKNLKDYSVLIDSLFLNDTTRNFIMNDGMKKVKETILKNKEVYINEPHKSVTTICMSKFYDVYVPRKYIGCYLSVHSSKRNLHFGGLFIANNDSSFFIKTY